MRAKFLIVDDVPVTRDLLAGLLKKYGDCLLAEDGVKALRTFHEAHQQKEPVDLILLDLAMPKMNGREVVVHVRQYERAFDIFDFVPIVILTGDEHATCALELFKLGCEEYLTKPVKGSELKRVMQKYGFQPAV